MKHLDLKISLVIPAYNEQEHIGACLNAIANLEALPYEVIVVDNLSTDQTNEIAKQYSFVKVVKANKQGLVYARDCGYDYATGDIIGRIDADTLLPTDWATKLQAIFASSNVQAVSGGLHFYDIGLSKIIDRVDSYWRAWMAERMAINRRIFLLGSNMAIRRSAWLRVREDLCRQSGLHEDLDLALHMSKLNQQVIFEPSLVANVSARRIDTSLLDLARYCLINPITYMKHNAKEHRYMYPLIVIVLLNYLILRLLFRLFDKQRQRLSLRMLFFNQSAARPNPAEF